jgi:hypothetical protein
MRRFIFLCAALAILPVFAQDKQKPSNKKQEQPAPKEPAPLFGGQIGIRSSQTKKESATLGFNGIDPSGKVESKMLAAGAGANDIERSETWTQRIPCGSNSPHFLRKGV